MVARLILVIGGFSAVSALSSQKSAAASAIRALKANDSVDEDPEAAPTEAVDAAPGPPKMMNTPPPNMGEKITIPGMGSVDSEWFKDQVHTGNIIGTVLGWPGWKKASWERQEGEKSGIESVIPMGEIKQKLDEVKSDPLGEMKKKLEKDMSELPWNKKTEPDGFSDTPQEYQATADALNKAVAEQAAEPSA
eukprot:gnl/MRDRNA2_/MRDRNA2_103729_c0_seq1.p1 gnl/MRDRNA2_/MRDRNA2_103729_c0~~gnl/MRDRNA2_/MRDRNA2_103729_c0_seq1.p1  ORF type:complete len:192 (-),score=52.47 gnl/MRDRNA2_/MRDRNA2_103729_c0_seq1:137-712(-)